MISSRACLSLQSKGHKSLKQKIKKEIFSDKSVVGLTTLPLCNVTREETRQEKEHHHCFPIELPFHKKNKKQKKTNRLYIRVLHSRSVFIAGFTLCNLQFSVVYSLSTRLNLTGNDLQSLLTDYWGGGSMFTSVAWEMPLWNPSYFFLLKKKLTCEIKTTATHFWQ